MRTRVFEAVERLFDRFEPRWERLQRGRVGSLLVAAFLLTLGLVELRRRGVLGETFSALVPASHFFAIEVAFTLLLLFELVTLVLALARSVASSVGKQLEVFSLVLLRRSFEALTEMPEPLTWHDLRHVVPAMAVDAGGALAVVGSDGLLGGFEETTRPRSSRSATRSWSSSTFCSCCGRCARARRTTWCCGTRGSPSRRSSCGSP